MKTGLTHIYTGDGKGKTTCAMGLALRAAGNGLSVCIFQFCKNGHTGEQRPLADLESVQFKRAASVTQKFVWNMTPDEKAAWCDAQQALFTQACIACCDENVDVVVMDEVLIALSSGAIEISQIEHLIDRKASGVELVMTGRGAPQELIDKADYVTEMRMIKHPYTQGQDARLGIEY